MGQVESTAANDQTAPPSSASAGGNNSPSSSFDSLISEAAAYGNEAENESLEAKARRALDCPCIAHLRKGSCGAQFSDAFLCFLKSNAPEKGSDCVHPFVALQSCIKENPTAFSRDVTEGGEVEKEEEKPGKGYKLYPPLWSVQSKPPKKN